LNLTKQEKFFPSSIKSELEKLIGNPPESMALYQYFPNQFAHRFLDFCFSKQRTLGCDLGILILAETTDKTSLTL